MRGKSLIFGSSALLAVAGFVGINGYYWWAAESDRSQTPPNDLSLSEAAGPPFPRNASRFSMNWTDAEVGDAPYQALHRETEHSPPLGYFPEHAETVEMAQADIPDLESSTTGDSPKLKPPRLLPDAAAPIAETPESDWLRELVRRELPDAGPEEVRVWSQELEGLGPEMARDILRMRKNVANSPPPQIGTVPEPSPEWTRVPEPAPNGIDRLVPPPLDESPATDALLADHLTPSIEAFEQSRRVILHNLANAYTPGFKRSRIVLSSRTAPSTPDETIDEEASPTAVNPAGEGVVLAATLLDMSQGSLKRTGQQLDLAIDGAGLFQVRVGEQLLFTRSGMGAIDARGRLCLINGGDLYPLEPPIWLPEEAISLRIDEFGQVKAAIPGHDRDLSDAREIGQIQLARFINDAGLKPRGGQLFSTTKASGPPKTGQPGIRSFGKILQGQLEQSNVSRDEELEEFYRIQAHWQLLNQLAESPASGLIPGPVAQRPVLRAQRASAARDSLTSPAFRSFKSLRDQGTNLIEDYLQSERVKSLKRNLGLN